MWQTTLSGSKKLPVQVNGDVASEQNPADHASRGLKAKELIASNWFTGPSFLWQENLRSEDVRVGDIVVEDPEVRKGFVNNTLSTEY